ncbi:hypothetical protein [Streptomyces sp. NPDC127114]|uniref:hypothetical protein n=1 Tax=Streptomyces sp. NPDC127114 TaxID=3345366 RepID=UPI0036456E7C
MTPSVEFAAHQVQLRLDAFDRIRAQLQAQRRLGGLGEVDDGLGRLRRVTRLTAVVVGQRARPALLRA